MQKGRVFDFGHAVLKPAFTSIHPSGIRLLFVFLFFISLKQTAIRKNGPLVNGPLLCGQPHVWVDGQTVIRKMNGFVNQRAVKQTATVQPLRANSILQKELTTLTSKQVCH